MFNPVSKDVDFIQTDNDTSSPLFQNAQVNEGSDAASNSSTNVNLSVGDTFSGTLSSNSDTDWVEINLTAGQTYAFFVWGTGGSSNGLHDSILQVYNSSGVSVAYNVDANYSDGNYFSFINYTPGSSGTYYIEVSAYPYSFSTNDGDYTLQTATNEFTAEQAATFITEFSWGVPTSLAFGSSNISVNISGLTADGQQLAEWALEAWENVSSLNFTLTNSSSADMTIDDTYSGAYAGPTSYDPNTGEIFQSSVNIGSSWINAYGTSLDSYSFLTYIHEIGHALGLGHAGPYDGYATYDDDAVYLNDSFQLTVMSYFGLTENTFINGSDVLPVTAMPADIIALQSLYGSSSAFTGNTTWGANSNVGGYLGDMFGVMFDGAADTGNILASNDIALTIYDTGGTDTLDLSTIDTANQTIDLTQGAASDIGGYAGNLVIAYDTIIENLIAGDSLDIITANAATNTIHAGGGNDRVEAGAGNDLVYGGDGHDGILGQSGNDTLHGGAGNDNIAASDGNDYVTGGIGNDQIGGGNGNDQLYGNAGNDTIGSGNNNDYINAGSGNDVASGGYGADSVYGGSGDDTLAGSYGNDYVYGENGDDTMGGGRGSDYMYGGAGNDSLGAGDENDFVYGESGNDFLGGGAGNDRLFGGGGNDTLNGGTGNDTLTGGAGTDVFVFNTFINGESDVITDFQNDTDTIRLRGVNFGVLDIQNNGGNAVISINGHTITLEGVSANALDANDFWFV